jgi:hypothetical protein
VLVLGTAIAASSAPLDALSAPIDAWSDPSSRSAAVRDEPISRSGSTCTIPASINSGLRIPC